MRVAVVGAGVVGLSASAALLERGAEVVCYERADEPMAERSAGSSRIFRLAHREPDLVARAADARAGFDRWAERAGRPMIVPSGCVISGADVQEWATAMEAAGAPVERPTAPDRLMLPTHRVPADALLDPSGGVVDVDAVREYLTGLTKHVLRHEPVEAVEADGHVWTRSGPARFDAVLLAAGAGTPALAARVGIAVPGELEHHARFTFPVEPAVAWRSWIDLPEAGLVPPAGSPPHTSTAQLPAGRTDEPPEYVQYEGRLAGAPSRNLDPPIYAADSRRGTLSTYQHASGPGRWAVGGHLDPAVTAWEVGRDAATAASRDAVLEYAREHLAVEPRIIETIYCTPTPGLGDGFHVQHAGRVVAVHGENLFKFAPVLGAAIAAACELSA
ncbi:FAD-dependent oxidoreductase [Pseudonocardia sp. DSM 110487]|uniref:FAD-dependent oxidoreductase n=1 Tax=Pseudonocardia sp. DSM 110487 TaxID=2865833 RepID=UPI001C69AF7F|nr:FAD-dependent oxidoreductase [Pseudonocardia sp. DSM 110487]QYN36671.1 FAD-dependent oxidoreductase [Pseudonocardia sp. DSM 110487]